MVHDLLRKQMGLATSNGAGPAPLLSQPDKTDFLAIWKTVASLY